jgi:hypothetical protein
LAQDSHLLAAMNRGKRCAQRNFGLAETNVPADDPVHWFFGCQVVQDFADRA